MTQQLRTSRFRTVRLLERSVAGALGAVATVASLAAGSLVGGQPGWQWARAVVPQAGGAWLARQRRLHGPRSQPRQRAWRELRHRLVQDAYAAVAEAVRSWAHDHLSRPPERQLA